MEEKGQKRSIWFGYWIMAAIILADCLSTLIFYEKGLATEANPFQGWLHLSVPRYLALKAVLGLIGLMFIWHFEERSKRFIRFLLTITIFIYPILYICLTVLVYKSTHP